MTDYSKVEKGSQYLGKQTFKYGIMPHAGNWEEANVWQESERFNLELTAAMVGPSKYGKNPTSKSFLEFKQEGIHVSAIKKSEDGNGWVVRLFNPFITKKNCTFCLNDGKTYEAEVLSPVERVRAEFELAKDNCVEWNKAELTNLEENPISTLEIDKRGFISIDIEPKKIITVKIS